MLPPLTTAIANTPYLGLFWPVLFLVVALVLFEARRL